MAQLMPLPLTVSCFSKIQVGFTFWYWLTQVVPDNGPLNGCVCVCVCVCSCHYLVCLLVRCCVPVLEIAINSLCICHFFSEMEQSPSYFLSSFCFICELDDVLLNVFHRLHCTVSPRTNTALMLLTHLYVPPSFFLFYQFV